MILPILVVQLDMAKTKVIYTYLYALSHISDKLFVAQIPPFVYPFQELRLALSHEYITLSNVA